MPAITQNVKKERDLNRYQNGLVDTCFEEGQYEAGIALLAGQRSSNYRPSGAHIRQLIYIALYPHPLAPLADRGNAKASSIPDSPSQFEIPKPKLSFQPTPVASRAAQRVLNDFATSNSADALLHGLPNYDHKDRFATALDNVDQDCFIAKQSIQLLSYSNCWALLKEDVVHRQEEPKSPMKKPSRKRKVEVLEEQEDRNAFQKIPLVVGPGSWFLLEWLIHVFERDQAQNSDALHSPGSSSTFSRNLLAQLPPSRNGERTRTDTSAALGIVFFCLAQREAWKAKLGVDLLNLLINLSSSPEFDGRDMRRDVSVRLSNLSFERIDLVFVSIPPSEIALRFIIAFCADYLNDLGEDVPKPKGRPRPQARPRPAFLYASNEPVAEKLKDAEPVPASRLPAHLSPSEVLGLIAPPVSRDTASDTPFRETLKFQLLRSFGMLHSHVLSPSDRSGDWRCSLNDGSIARSVETAFPGDSTSRAALDALIKDWHSSAEVTH